MATTSTQKTVLITGATRGIGVALATWYSKAGWKVIGCARNLNAATLLEAVHPYKIVQLDASDEASIRRAAKDLEGELIDVVISNAASASMAPFLEISKEDMMTAFEVNAVGPYVLTAAFQPHLAAAAKAHGSSSLVYISSFAGSVNACPEQFLTGTIVAYQMSKAALNIMAVNAARKLKEDGIVVTAIHPGTVRTEGSGGYGDISTEESASGIANVVASTTMKQTGGFVNWKGETLPW